MGGGRGALRTKSFRALCVCVYVQYIAQHPIQKPAPRCCCPTAPLCLLWQYVPKPLAGSMQAALRSQRIVPVHRRCALYAPWSHIMLLPPI